MAIIVICKKCKGTGNVEKTLLKFLNVKSKCSVCHGKGKRDISKSKNTYYS